MIAADKRMNTPSLFERMKSAATAFFVHKQQGPRFLLQEFDQLRSRDTQLQRGPGKMPEVSMHHVESFGHQRWEVFVIDVASDPIAMSPRTPQFGRSGFGQVRRANLQRDVHPQSLQGHPMIIKLAATLGRLTFHPRRCVMDHDRRFRLVPMLATRPPTARVSNVTITQQLLDWCLRRVEDRLSHNMAGQQPTRSNWWWFINLFDSVRNGNPELPDQLSPLSQLSAPAVCKLSQSGREFTAITIDLSIPPKEIA